MLRMSYRPLYDSVTSHVGFPVVYYKSGFLISVVICQFQNNEAEKLCPNSPPKCRYQMVNLNLRIYVWKLICDRVTNIFDVDIVFENQISKIL